MIVVGIAMIIVGAFLGLVSTAGFDEARKETREFGLPTGLLVIAVAVTLWGIWVVKTA